MRNLRDNSNDGDVGVWVRGLTDQAKLAARRQGVPVSIADDVVQEVVHGLYMDCLNGKLTPKEARRFVSHRVKFSAINLRRKEATQTCHADPYSSIYDSRPGWDGGEFLDLRVDESMAPVEDTVFLKMKLEALAPVYKELRDHLDGSPERIRAIDELAAAGMTRREIADELADRGIVNDRGNPISPDSVAQDIHRHLTSKFPEIAYRWSQRGA